MSRRRPTRKATSLTEAQKEILRQEEEVRRREAELIERLKKLPEEEQKRREEKRRMQKVYSSTVAMGEMPYRHRRASPATERRLRREKNLGKIRFMVLCLIFALLLIILWRVMPA